MSPEYWASDPYVSSSQTMSRGYSHVSNENGMTSPLDNLNRLPHLSQTRPSIHFSNLIPMYPSSRIDSGSQLLNFSYEDHWSAANLTQSTAFQRQKYPHCPSPSYIPPQRWTSASRHPHESTSYSSPSPSVTTASSATTLAYLVPSSDGGYDSLRKTYPNPAKKSCFHCHVTSTPMWRREPSTLRPLCNACGLYLQQRNKLRPQALIDADIDDDEPQVPDEEYTGPKCSHCNTRQTSVWRRSKTGAQVCNACGVYARLRGKDRPLALKRNKIKPRMKHSESL